MNQTLFDTSYDLSEVLECPRHWEKNRIRYLFKIVGGGTPNTDDMGLWGTLGDIPWASPKDMISNTLSTTEDHVLPLALDNSPISIVPEDSVLMVFRSGILKHTLPVCTNAIETTLNQDMKGFIPLSRITSRYFSYFVLGNQNLLLSLWRKHGATVESLEFEDVVKTIVPLPPLPVQKAIASYLDRETARVDALIAKKERQIELLEEKRQAVITRAVTKGLNPNAKMRDSGVEWIGEIPEGWKVRRLRHLVFLKSGEGITSEEINTEGLYPVYGGNGLRGFVSAYTHDGKYVLIGRQGALCGNINYAEGKFWASEHAVVATPVIPLESLWLGEVLRVMNLNQYSISAAQPGIAVDRIKDLFLPVPPIHVQKEISIQLTKQIAESQKLQAQLNTSITLLREYRSSLITAAVSGQVDVSQEVVP
jgi:type I restriction enzyme S subunit